MQKVYSSSGISPLGAHLTFQIFGASVVRLNFFSGFKTLDKVFETFDSFVFRRRFTIAV